MIMLRATTAVVPSLAKTHALWRGKNRFLGAGWIARGIRSLALAASASLFSAIGFVGPVTFSFNDLGANSINVSMTNALHAAGYATASASATGAVKSNNYDGDGHVVGDTLGTSDGGVHHSGNDYFIVNNNISGSSDSFTLTFVNFYVTSFSTDWEIFPDASCQIDSNHSCSSGNYPDMTVYAGGVLLSTPTIVAAIPASSDSHGQKDPQGIGSISIALGGPVQTLTFKDWPAEVGVDNIAVDGCTYFPCTPPRLQTPEPSLPVLLAAALLVMTLVRRKTRGRTRT